MNLILLILLGLATPQQAPVSAKADDWRAKLVSTKKPAEDGGYILVFTTPENPDYPVTEEYFNAAGKKYKSWDNHGLGEEQTDYFDTNTGKRQSSELIAKYREERCLTTYLADGETVSGQTILSLTGAVASITSNVFRPGTKKLWISSSVNAGNGYSVFQYFPLNRKANLERTVNKDRMTVQVTEERELEVINYEPLQKPVNVQTVLGRKTITTVPVKTKQMIHLGYRQTWVMQKPEKKAKNTRWSASSNPGHWVLQSVDLFAPGLGNYMIARFTMKADGVTVDSVAELEPKPGQGCIITEYRPKKVLKDHVLTDIERSVLKEFAPRDDLSIPSHSAH